MGKFRAAHGKEYYIQEKVVRALKEQGWHVERLTGNAFQSGLPDLLAMHPKYGMRLIDIKVAGSYNYTRAQRYKWPIHHTFGGGAYIITSVDEIPLLMGEPNWLDYWKPSWGDPFQSLEDRIDEALEDMFLDEEINDNDNHL